jgi:RNA polymerase sigma-70 factor (ECF subfamily)
MVLEEECKKHEDEALVGLVLANPDYYACLVNRYTEGLRRYVLRLGCRPSDVDDVLQEVFLNVYLHLNDFDKKLKFSSWLYRITHNQTISFFRKVNVRPTVELTDLEPWQELVLSSCPSAQLDKTILTARTKAVLDQLDPRYREILVLKYFEEKDYNEMSDILKKPMGTIATLVNRAKKQFIKLAEGQTLN